MQWPAHGGMLLQSAVGAKAIDEAALPFIQCRVRHPDIARDVLNAVGGERLRDLRIVKRVARELHQIEVRIEDVNSAVGAAIGRVEKELSIAAANGEACVAGANAGAI